MNCPNCGNEIAEDAVTCPKCGNPLVSERPWDKKAKIKTRRKEEETFGAAESSVPEQKVKRVKEIKKALSGGSRPNVINEETYLDHEFIVSAGYCGFTENPEKPEILSSGTVILTKKAILFGDSEYKIKCGRFKVEIPLKLIDYYSDEYMNGKNMIVLHTVHDQKFYLFVRKRQEWLKYFGFVLKYVPKEQEAGGEERKGADATRWIKCVIYAIIAIACFLFAFYMDIIAFMKIVFILFGAGFALLSAVTAFVKKK